MRGTATTHHADDAPLGSPVTPTVVAEATLYLGTDGPTTCTVLSAPPSVLEDLAAYPVELAPTCGDQFALVGLQGAVAIPRNLVRRLHLAATDRDHPTVDVVVRSTDDTDEVRVTFTTGEVAVALGHDQVSQAPATIR